MNESTGPLEPVKVGSNLLPARSFNSSPAFYQNWFKLQLSSGAWKIHTCVIFPSHSKICSQNLAKLRSVWSHFSFFFRPEPSVLSFGAVRSSTKDCWPPTCLWAWPRWRCLWPSWWTWSSSSSWAPPFSWSSTLPVPQYWGSFAMMRWKNFHVPFVKQLTPTSMINSQKISSLLQSLRHPYHPSTVSTPVNVIVRWRISEGDGDHDLIDWFLMMTYIKILMHIVQYWCTLYNDNPRNPHRQLRPVPDFDLGQLCGRREGTKTRQIFKGDFHHCDDWGFEILYLIWLLSFWIIIIYDHGVCKGGSC